MTAALLAAIFAPPDDGSHDGPFIRRAEDAVHPAATNAQDDAMVLRIRAGDVAEYETLFRTYFTSLSDFAESIVGSSDAAEELTQDVLWGVWERRAEWAVHGTVRAYLFSAVRYRALNLIRDERHRARLLERDAAARVAALEHGDAGVAVESADLAAHLRSAIAQLPATRRQVLILRWDHGLSYAEIAAIVGSSVKAVENQLNRTLKQLRELLAHLAP